MPRPYRWQKKVDQLRNRLRAMFRSDRQGPRPRLCPSCNTLVGTTATRCHECGASLTFSLAAASKSFAGILPGETSATTIIFITNILLFGVSLIVTMRGANSLNLFGGIDGQVLARLGESQPLPLLYMQDQWWRLVTAIFLHGSLIHIAMNSWVLMDIGPPVEKVYGSARYLFLYVATGAIGFFVSALSGHFSVGASGSIMGLVGLLLAITNRRGGAYMATFRRQLMVWVLSIFIFGLVVRGVDNYAHFGGLASGFLLGRVFADREPLNAVERKRAYIFGWIAGIVLVASFAFMLINYFRSVPTL
ncbi:MAG TPA: rhomboid family intramembrane serine protease [Candidatus Dormibacteraeota bacterium]|nr:rhomboid family intramembrane serine protease [Candidatus Dormibacteraeota bacterium]